MRLRLEVTPGGSHGGPTRSRTAPASERRGRAIHPHAIYGFALQVKLMKSLLYSPSTFRRIRTLSSVLMVWPVRSFWRGMNS